MSSPWELPDGPCTLNVSGGRSSAMMLWHVLEYYDGTLPADAVASFQNTGKERAETLDFLREIETRWGVPILWLEYRYFPEAAGGRKDPRHTSVRVTYDTASRNSEPFDMLIQSKKRLPDIAHRFCTSRLKVEALSWWMVRQRGWKKGEWMTALGIRADEQRRISKALFEECKTFFPLADAGITRKDVMAFWSAQPFDLQLRPDQSNCDLCFLKGRKILERIVGEEPERLGWWTDKEEQIGELARSRGALKNLEVAQFSKRYPYSSLTESTMDLFDEPAIDCFCGD